MLFCFVGEVFLSCFIFVKTIGKIVHLRIIFFWVYFLFRIVIQLP